jgi:hypothetical protein
LGVTVTVAYSGNCGYGDVLVRFASYVGTVINYIVAGGVAGLASLLCRA